MLGNKVVLDYETFNKFGYYTSSLSVGSRKPVVFSCDSCKIQIIRPYREFKTKHLCSIRNDKEKRCFKCKTWKNFDDFPKNRNNHYDGLGKLCKECFSKYDSVKLGYERKSKKIKIDILERLKHRVSSIKSRSLKKGIEFSLSYNDVKECYDRLDGKCYYTGVTLIYGDHSPVWNSLSIDRKDPNKGYTKDNITLCCYCINSFKNDYSEKDFINILKLVIPNLTKFVGK